MQSANNIHTHTFVEVFVRNSHLPGGVSQLKTCSRAVLKLMVCPPQSPIFLQILKSDNLCIKWLVCVGPCPQRLGGVFSEMLCFTFQFVLAGTTAFANVLNGISSSSNNCCCCQLCNRNGYVHRRNKTKTSKIHKRRTSGV